VTLTVPSARRVPLGALGLSVAAFLVPLVCAIYLPESLAERGDLLWVLALVPAFLLAYYRGWRGINVALAIGMAALSLVVTLGPLMGVHVRDWWLFLVVVAPYTAIALGAGWYSDVSGARRSGVVALRASEERFRVLADASFEAVAIHDQGTILDANASFIKLFGYELAEVVGMLALDLTAPESRDLVESMMRQGSEEPFEAMGLRKDGSTFIGELRGKALPYHGRVVRVATLRDITQLRRSDDALRRLGKALDTMQLGVTMTGVDGRITYVNPADARMHGYDVAELLGQDVGVYAPTIRRPMDLARLHALYSWNRESTNARKDGSLFPVKLHSDVMHDGDGRVTGVVTTCEDITERKQAEGRLRRTSDSLRRSHIELELTQLQLIEAERLESVGRLAAGVAHEVKNPLMTLLTGVRYLAGRQDTKDADVSVLLDDMAEAVMRADTVIRGLLDFAAPRKLDLQCQNLNDIVERSLLLMKHDLDKGQITLVRELDAELPALMLDTFKLQQVLINLVTNAVHATPPGGRVVARTRRRTAGDPIVVLEIEDTGSGIPEKALTKVFDPFFTTKPTGTGTGLGLSVSRQIVQMHGGELDLTNRAEGGVRATIAFTHTSRGHSDDQAPNSAGG
jgi:PAS domain S-box-containing protein